MNLRALPKVLLHDHLDGGLRTITVLELAASVGHTSPRQDPGSLQDWFLQGESGSLEAYLEAFAETVAVMQTPKAVERVAYEAGMDLAADGVVYAEQRFAPALATEGGSTLDEVIEAGKAGLHRAELESGAVLRFICDAMRQNQDSDEVVEAAIRAGVAGFDLAGPERGFPPSRHALALRRAREAGLGITIHAGEADGLASIVDALACGAERLGHGVRIIDDCTIEDGRIVDLGPVASQVHGSRVPLEICPTSNLHTMGISAAEHPVGMLHRAGFEVTISTDDRLMSGTSMSAEFELLAREHQFTNADLAQVTSRALRAAFVDEATKERLWFGRIAPAYEEAGVEHLDELSPLAP